MNKELAEQGWLYPEEPEPKIGHKIEYMHDGEISTGIYYGHGLVDDDLHPDLLQEVDLWRNL